MDIGQRMIAERQREIAVSLKALHMMQEHHNNRYMGFKCVPSAEEAEWYAKAEKLIQQGGVMIDEADVQREFLHGPLTFRGAVIALQKIGYLREDAEDMVAEWANDAANDNDRNKGYDITDSDYDEQMGGY